MLTAACQGRLLRPVLPLLLAILDPQRVLVGAGTKATQGGGGCCASLTQPAIQTAKHKPQKPQEAALTCLGNLASWPPNTVHMVETHPELLTYLLRMLGEPMAALTPDAELIAYGAAYLSGNLSYISPLLVGQRLFCAAAYRDAIAELTRQALAHHNQTGAFWALWSACHAHDAAREAQPALLRLHLPFQHALSDNLSVFTARFGPHHTIPCLWSNLRGVFRLISSPTIAIRAFGWWLMGNINYQVGCCCCRVRVWRARPQCPPALQQPRHRSKAKPPLPPSFADGSAVRHGVCAAVSHLVRADQQRRGRAAHQRRRAVGLAHAGLAADRAGLLPGGSAVCPLRRSARARAAGGVAPSGRVQRSAGAGSGGCRRSG